MHHQLQQLVIFLLLSCSCIAEKANVILMIADGFGPTSQTFARNLYQYEKQLSVDDTDWVLPLDPLLVGTSRTAPSHLNVNHSSSRPQKIIPITDSAAGATAFSCGIKTYNGAIGVDVDHRPCGTILEAAHRQGLKTGIVVTSRVTHATPATFTSHAVLRSMESLIAEYQVGLHGIHYSPDLMFGGGRCQFLPNTGKRSGSCRCDTKDLLAMASQKGCHTLTDRAQFMALSNTSASLPVLGLFALDHLAYEIDRDPELEPSLAEMTRKSLQILDHATRDSDHGFILVVEGSKIDMASHCNDPATHYRDIISYQEAVKVVKQYIDASSTRSTMISVSDHECGGLSLGLDGLADTFTDYVWYPEPVLKVVSSAEKLSRMLYQFAKHQNNTGLGGPVEEYIRTVLLSRGLNVKVTSEHDLLVQRIASHWKEKQVVTALLGEFVSTKANIGWSSHGHTAADVNLYCYGQECSQLTGNHDNTDIGKFITRLLDLDLASVTDMLKTSPVDQSKLPGFDCPPINEKVHVEHYHDMEEEDKGGDDERMDRDMVVKRL